MVRCCERSEPMRHRVSRPHGQMCRTIVETPSGVGKLPPLRHCAEGAKRGRLCGGAVGAGRAVECLRVGGQRAHIVGYTSTENVVGWVGDAVLLHNSYESEASMTIVTKGSEDTQPTAS